MRSKDNKNLNISTSWDCFSCASQRLNICSILHSHNRGPFDFGGGVVGG